jgi:hypothetical protein
VETDPSCAIALLIGLPEMTFLVVTCPGLRVHQL